MNTAGAAIGVLLLGFVVLEQLGVMVTCLAVAAVNAAVFLVTRVAARRLPVVGVPFQPTAMRDGSTPNSAPLMSIRTALIVVTITGLVTFGLEVTWFRALRAAFWSTSQTFSILLAAVLIPLAIGARAVPWLRTTWVSPAGLLAASGAAILLATPFIERMDLMVGSFPESYYATLAYGFGWTLALVSPPILLLGTVLPWALEDHPDTRAIGWLYGFNSLGAIVGSVLAAWVLLPNLGMARASWLLGGLVLSASFLALKPKQKWIPVVVGSVALFVAVNDTSSPGRDRLYGKERHDTSPILAHREGPDFTTSVIARVGGVRLLLIDGFAASSERKHTGEYMHWMGSLPALLHSEPEDALVICFGTGQTANGLRLETTGNIDMVDVSGAVFELAHLFKTNQGVLEDPRTRAIEMDGRAWLRRTHERYDVVTLEPMPPNFAGVNSLYSREFYELLSERLNEDGVAAQWLPVHLLSPEHSASIVATFIDVFPDALLWWDPIGGTGILVGRKSGSAAPIGTEWPGLEEPSVERRLRPEQIRRAVWLDPPALEKYARRGQIISDDNQMLQFGRMRPGLSRESALESSLRNQAIIEKIAGRPPFALRGRRR
jgi:spermidine synthase